MSSLTTLLTASTAPFCPWGKKQQHWGPQLQKTTSTQAQGHKLVAGKLATLTTWALVHQALPMVPTSHTPPTDKSIQAHLVEPHLCPRTSSCPASFPGQEQAPHCLFSAPTIQKQNWEGKGKSAHHRIQRHNVVEHTRLH